VRGGRKSKSLREREIDRERESEWMEAVMAAATRSGGFGDGVEIKTKKNRPLPQTKMA